MKSSGKKVIESRFESGAILDEKQEEIRTKTTVVAPVVAEGSLYERLERNRLMKEEETKEKMKMSRSIRLLDAEDVAFLEQQKQQEMERKKREREEEEQMLQEFKKKQVVVTMATETRKKEVVSQVADLGIRKKPTNALSLVAQYDSDDE